MVTMAFWPLVMPFKTASIVEIITGLVVCIVIAAKLFKHANFKLIFLPFVFSSIFQTIGINFLMTHSDTVLKRFLGVALIILSIYFIFSKKAIKIKPTLLNKFLVGSISGILSGICNVGGPPVAIYVLSATDDKKEYSATLQMYFVLAIIYGLIVHILYGNISFEIMKFSALGLIGVVFGVILGYFVFKKLSTEKIKKLVYIAMVVMGLILIING